MQEKVSYHVCLVWMGKSIPGLRQASSPPILHYALGMDFLSTPVTHERYFCSFRHFSIKFSTKVKSDIFFKWSSCTSECNADTAHEPDRGCHANNNPEPDRGCNANTNPEPDRDRDFVIHVLTTTQYHCTNDV